MPKSKEFISDSESDSDGEAPKAKKSKKETKKEAPPKKTPAASSNSNSDEKSFQISKNRFVTVSTFRGKVFVGIREFYDADGELRPGKKGISLPIDQWNRFLDQIDEVKDAVKQMS